jgi:TP53 regulating kinase-like protein
MKIEMEYIKGDKFRDVFSVGLCGKIGRYVAKMHNDNIIHGDLTTSNMILKGKEIYFIDFGLSYFSAKVEDKAVDLHLLKEALESKHYKKAKAAFKEILKEYKKEANSQYEIISRFLLVEERGRHKNK